MIVHPRTAVRKYCKELLKAKITSVKNVFLNRPAPELMSELPCIQVSFSTEAATVIAGTPYHANEYSRDMRINIDIITEEKVIPGLDGLNKSEKTEDFLDSVAFEIERAMSADSYFAQLRPGYDANTNYAGLLTGSALVSTDPYDIDTDTEVRICVQRLQYSVTYQTPNYVDLKGNVFQEYYAEFNRTDGEIVDVTLTAAEGTL